MFGVMCCALGGQDSDADLASAVQKCEQAGEAVNDYKIRSRREATIEQNHPSGFSSRSQARRHLVHGGHGRPQDAEGDGLVLRAAVADDDEAVLSAPRLPALRGALAGDVKTWLE